MAIPMHQIEFACNERQFSQDLYPSIFANRKASFGGFDYSFAPTKTFLHTPEQRLAFFEQLWQHGDFHFWLGTYHDVLSDKHANAEAYKFWRDKVRPRIADPVTREILAPMLQPFAFGTKRVPLENGYFDLFNRQNVKLVDVNATPISQITKKGILTKEKQWEFDCIIAATGFDNITGGFDQIDIQGTQGRKLKDKWSSGLKTYLGMAVSGFPNLFFTYGPQAPTAFCNGPTCAELQGEWIVQMLNGMNEKGLQRVEAEEESERKWAEIVTELAHATLLPETKSWYMGDNIPGKRREVLLYLGGVPAYHKTLEEVAREGYKGFHMT